MNKNILLLTLLFITSLIYGCDIFNEEIVPDPKPAPKINYTPIDENNKNSIIGKYMVNILKIEPAKGIYTSYMDGYIQLQFQPDGSLGYNYDLTYNPYDINGNIDERSKKTKFGIIEKYRIKDNRTITLDTPIEFKTDKQLYTITSIQKYDNDIISLDDTQKVDEIFYEKANLCDPKVASGSESCSDVLGALKYVGYYRIEKLKCDNTEYIGGKDFAGEMVAAPSLEKLSKNIVDLPLDIKIQIDNNTLKQCFLKTEEQSSNIYLKRINYELILGDKLVLENIFPQVGLLGLKEETDKNIRTTEINFQPKNPDFSDMKFGNENKTVSMRLKVIKNGKPVDDKTPPVRKLDNTPYIIQ